MLQAIIKRSSSDHPLRVVITFDADLRFDFPRWLLESADRRRSSRGVEFSQIHFGIATYTPQIQFVFEFGPILLNVHSALGRIPELCSKQFLGTWFDIRTNMFPHIVKKNFLKKVEKCKCYKHLTKITNIYIIIIIKLQKPISELCSKQLLFFLFDIHNNMFPNIVKKVFLKKIEKCKC